MNELESFLKKPIVLAEKLESDFINSHLLFVGPL